MRWDRVGYQGVAGQGSGRVCDTGLRYHGKVATHICYCSSFLCHKRQRRHIAAKVREAAYKRQEPCARRVARESPSSHLSIFVMLHTDLPHHLPPTNTTTHKYCVYVCQHVLRTLTVAEHYVGGVVPVTCQPAVWGIDPEGKQQGLGAKVLRGRAAGGYMTRDRGKVAIDSNTLQAGR